jgi:hypothetical protein
MVIDDQRRRLDRVESEKYVETLKLSILEKRNEIDTKIRKKHD